jgi:plasmid stabilization system protein ParE
VYRLVSQPDADLDVETAFAWYEAQREGLGFGFLYEIRNAYDRIVSGPTRYRVLRDGVRRVLLRRFPYAAYFAIESDALVVLAVLQIARDPTAWQSRAT